MGLSQNEEPIASFNKLRDEVLCLKTQISELRVNELWSLAKKFPVLNVKYFSTSIQCNLLQHECGKSYPN